MSRRRLSHSELTSMHSCEQQHDYRYVGHTAGSALKPKRTAIVLREGRAWGAGVAAWHATGDLTIARAAMHLSLKEDAEQLHEHGFYNEHEHHVMVESLDAILDHYVSDAIRIPLQQRELQLLVPIPSRSGGRASSLYDFEGYVDGIATDLEDRDWIVEFKLRKQLQAHDVVARSPQLRRYAWGWHRQTGRQIAGIIVDERLNAAPKPARMNKGRVTKADPNPAEVPSHAKDQMCTPQAYVKACTDAGVEPVLETFEALKTRRWGERHTILLTAPEIARTGRQLVSSAQSLRELESRRRDPVPNPDFMRCGMCAFKEICPGAEPDLVDALFERVPAKRDRPPDEQREQPAVPVAA